LTTLLTRDTVRAPEEPGQLASVMHLMRQRLERYLVPTGVPGLSLLPAGPPTEINPGELAAAPEMGQLLEVLRTAADVVILDSPPVLPVADTAIMASKGLSVLLVVDAGRTHNEAARHSSDILLRAQARVLGTVLNRTAHSGPRFFHFGAPDRSEVEPRWETPLRFLFPPRPEPGPGRPGGPAVETPEPTGAER
jgi:Mrp family chromosome partitioning ATPase